MMLDIWNSLKGKRSYLGFIALGIVGLCWNQGWLDTELAQALAIAIGSLTGIAVRAGISASNPTAKPKKP